MSVDSTNEKGAMRSVRSGRLVGLFTDDERNALMTALQCAAVAAQMGCPFTDKSPDEIATNDQIYSYLEGTPKTSLVSEIVDELHRLGWRIQPNKAI